MLALQVAALPTNRTLGREVRGMTAFSPKRLQQMMAEDGVVLVLSAAAATPS